MPDMGLVTYDQRGYMRRAIREAEKARGTCSPNPFVGAVIVKDGNVISTGCTQTYGGDHAEVVAIRKAGSRTRGAEIYVTLEPCSHYGKTPPCTQAIIASGIKRVFYGIQDPNPLVNPLADVDGPGIISMREQGIAVQGGILAAEITTQLEAWLCRVRFGRPYVIWKTALSLDGKYAAQDGSSRWITGPEARKKVHLLRAGSDVVLTGIGTVLADDPVLNVRLGKPVHQPVRAVLDTSLRISVDSALVQSARMFPLYVFHAAGVSDTQKQDLLQAGVTLYEVPCTREGLDLPAVLQILHQLGYYSVLAECGDGLSTALIEARLVDKVVAFMSPKLVGGKRCILSDLGYNNINEALCLSDLSFKRVGTDIMLQAYPRY